MKKSIKYISLTMILLIIGAAVINLYALNISKSKQKDETTRDNVEIDEKNYIFIEE